MLEPKNIKKEDFCENDYTIKLPFLPTHTTERSKANYKEFYNFSKSKIDSKNYTQWRKKFDEFLNVQIKDDSTLLLNFYKELYNPQQAEVIRNKVLYSNQPILNCGMAIILTNLAETRREIPEAHFGREIIDNPLEQAQKHSLVVLQSQNLEANLYLSFYGLPAFKPLHAKNLETIKTAGLLPVVLDKAIPTLVHSPANILKDVSKLVLDQNNADLSFKFMQNTKYDFEKHGQVLLNSNNPQIALDACKTFGKDKLPIYKELQKNCMEYGTPKDIIAFARLKDANLTMCANAISKFKDLVVCEVFLREHNGHINRSIVLAPILEEGGFKAKRAVKKLEKQLDKELHENNKGLERKMF